MRDMYSEMCTIGLRPNIVTMTTIIAHAGDAGKCGMVEQLWEVMRSQGLEPDVQTYTARLNCYAKAGQMDSAEAVLAEMSATSSTKPNAVSYGRSVSLHSDTITSVT